MLHHHHHHHHHSEHLLFSYSPIFPPSRTSNTPRDLQIPTSFLFFRAVPTNSPRPHPNPAFPVQHVMSITPGGGVWFRSTSPFPRVIHNLLLLLHIPLVFNAPFRAQPHPEKRRKKLHHNNRGSCNVVQNSLLWKKGGENHCEKRK